MNKSILTIIPSLYGGGAEKIVADISFRLSEKYNHKILIYNKTLKKYNYKGDLIEINVPQKKSVVGKIIRQLQINKKISQTKKKSKVEVSISHMLISNMQNLLTKNKEKTICVLHGEWSIKSGKNKILDKYIKKQYAKADMIISVSEYIKTMFDSYYNLLIPHEVAYIGVDNLQIEERALETIAVELPENFIVYVAGFRPVKNHIQLIEHIELYLKQTDLYLVLIGDGELRSEIEKKVLELNLNKKIILLGNLINPYPVVKKAKLSLLTSSSESFSLVVVESMVLGIPVIATDCGGPREIIDVNWKNPTKVPLITDYGVLIEKPNKWKYDSLIEQIDKLINDDELYERISKFGKVRANDFYLSKTKDNFEKIINKI